MKSKDMQLLKSMPFTVFIGGIKQTKSVIEADNKTHDLIEIHSWAPDQNRRLLDFISSKLEEFYSIDPIETIKNNTLSQ